MLRQFVMPSGVAPNGIAVGPDGNLWFTEQNGALVGRIYPMGNVTPFSLPGSKPWDVTVGSDGNLWFTDRTDRIGRMTPSGTATEFNLPATGAGL
jgi:virginiamycin B lyase